MHGFIRQLFDYDGSNLFPRTRPDAFVSCLYDSNAVGIPTIGELIDTSYMDPSVAWETEMGWEPEFIYRVNHEQAQYDSSGYGSLKAAKISQIPGLKFDAILKDPLPVSNVVGIAGTTENSPGGVYPAGTALELIIREMLTAGASIYDVMRELPGCTFDVTLSSMRGNVSNGSSYEYEEGEQYNLSYGYTFSDGYFYNPAGYDLNTFITLNSNGSNAAHFHNNKLYADVSVLSVKLLEDTEEKRSSDNPGYEYSTDYTLTVKSGRHTYSIVVSYTAKADDCQPYKSDGSVSLKTIPAGSKTFTFTIIGINAKDVTATPPTIDNSTLSIGSDIIVTSIYDLQHPEEPTGIWVGDDVSIVTHNFLRNMTDGYYSPGTGYNLDLFNSNNNVNNGILDASNAVVNVKCSINNNLATNVNSYEWPIGGEIGHNNGIKIEYAYGPEPYPSVGDNTSICFYINYANSPVVPKKSNGEDSTVRVPNGSLTISGSFNASVDKDVIPNTPKVSIYEVHFDPSQNLHAGDDVSGYVNFYICDGYYSPANDYPNAAFISNNPGSYNVNNKGRLDADCLPFDVSCRINSGTPFTVGSLTYQSNLHQYHGTAYFNNLHLLTHNTFTITAAYNHSNPDISAHKYSSRISDISINAGTDSSTVSRDFSAPQAVYHYVMVTTDDTSLGNPTLYTDVTQLLSNANYTIHCNETSTNLPNLYESPVDTVNYAGIGRRIMIVAAPSDYDDVVLYSNGTPMNTGHNAIIFTADSYTIPYSSGVDNTTYKLFRAKGMSSGFINSNVHITKPTH